jgi:hypothetical protein
MNESIHGERTASKPQDRVTELIEHQTAIFGSAARHCELAARLAAHLRRHPRQRHTSLSSRHSSLWVRSILDAYHKAKTQRPHAKSRHGSSFSAIKMQRLQTDRLRRTRAVHIALPCAIYSLSSFSKLAPFYLRRLSGRDLLAGSLRSVI